MPLQMQNASIPFSRGIDTKTSALNVQPPFLLDIQNGVLDKGGAISKRNGYTALPTDIIGGGSISQGEAIATLREQILCFDGANGYAYMEQAQAWINRGVCVKSQASNRLIFSTAASESHISSDYCNDVGVFAWEDSRGGVRASIIDYTTGTPYVSDTQLSASGSRPVVIATESTIVILYADGANHICTRYVSSLTPTSFSAETQLYTTTLATPEFDADLFGDKIALAYHTAVLGPTIIAFVTPLGQDAYSAGGSPPALSFSFANAVDGLRVQTVSTTQDYILVTSISRTNNKVEAICLNSGLTNLTLSGINPYVSITTTDIYSAGHVVYADSTKASGYCATMFWEARPALTSIPTLKYIDLDFNEYINVTPSARGSNTTVAYNCAMASRPFMLRGVPVVMSVFSSTTQPTYFLFDKTPSVVSRHLPSLGGNKPSKVGLLSRIATPTDTAYAIALPSSGTLTSDNGTFFTTQNVSELIIDTDSSVPFNTAMQGNNLYIAGAQLMLYDGTSLVEDGFHVFPEGMALSSQPAGSITAGTRNYVQVFAWIDARGQIHRSAPSAPFQVINAGATQNVLALPCLGMTNKTGVFLEVYRTVASGTIYYKVTSSTAPVANVTTSASVSFTDNTTDASLVSNEILYTNGGVLPNDAAPALLQVQTFQNRLVGLSAESDNTLYYSQEYTPGKGVGWSLALTKTVPARGGIAQTVATMDDKCVIYKPNNCYYFYGTGPTPTGANDTFSPITLLSADVGCENQSSIALTADGLMFQSNKGIRLLDRQLQFSYPGAPVAAYDTVTLSSAVLVQNKNQVRFTSETDRALVYDYYWQAPSPAGDATIGQWSTWTNHTAVSAVLWQQVYCYLRADGTVYVESGSDYTDNGAFIPLKVQTAWLSLGGPQTWFRLQRAALLGSYYSPHLLRIGIAYDYYDQQQTQLIWDPVTATQGDVYGTDDTFGASSVFGGSSPQDSVYQVRINPSRQRAQAVRFTFEEAPTAEGLYGQGYALNNLALQFGITGGIKRLGSAKTAT